MAKAAWIVFQAAFAVRLQVVVRVEACWRQGICR